LLYFKQFFRIFGVIWTKGYLRNNLKAKINKKISKWRAPIKNQNEEGPNLKISWLLQYAASPLLQN
jgi:hypothetical protein